MKISELIELLYGIQFKHGDIHVAVDSLAYAEEGNGLPAFLLVDRDEELLTEYDRRESFARQHSFTFPVEVTGDVYGRSRREG